MSGNYDSDVQELFICMMLTDPELYVRASNILKPSYFDKKNSNVIGFMHQYAEKHNGIPNSKIINAKFKSSFEELESLNESHKDWFLDTIEDFCKRKAIEEAIIQGSEMLEKGNYGDLEKMVKDATLVSLQRNMGTDYFADPRERLEKLRMMNGNLSTGWKTLDEAVYQISYGELILFSAISGGGKSVAMQNMTLNFALQGMNVVYITLELGEELVAKRLDAMLTGIPNSGIFKNMDNVELQVKTTGKRAGKIFIKYMEPGTCPNDIKAYLREFTIQQGVKPDALVIDYMDLMHPNQKRIDAGNLFIKDKLVAEQLRSLGSPEQFNLVCVSSVQTNRCLTLDTLVSRNDEDVRIDQLKVGDMIDSSDGQVEVKVIHDIYEQDVYRIILESGEIIECSVKHEFPTDGEVKSILSGLEKGDKLYTKNGEIEISDIEYISKKETIDIEVSGNRLFFANEILTHNSGYDETLPGINAIAGGISKGYTADLMINIGNTSVLRERGEIEFQLIKTRNSGGNGTVLTMAYDIDTLKISDMITSEDTNEKVDPHTGEIKNVVSNQGDQIKNLLSKIKK